MAIGVTEQSGPVPDCVIGILMPPVSELPPLGPTSRNVRRPMLLELAFTVKLKLNEPAAPP